MDRTIYLDLIEATGWDISSDGRGKIKEKAYNSTKTYLENFKIFVPDYPE